MSEIERFLGKPITKMINEKEFIINPFCLEDLKMLTSFEDKETRGKALVEMIDKVLKENFPDATVEQRNKFEFKYLSEVIDAISEVNDMKISTGDKKLMEKISELRKSSGQP